MCGNFQRETSAHRGALNMSYATIRQDFISDLSASGALNANPPTDGGVWRGLLHALIDPRQSQQDRRMAHFIQCRGGRLTDDIERQLIPPNVTTDSCGRPAIPRDLRL
jgi:hypothetical protein